MSQAVSDRPSGFKSSNLRNDQRKRDQTLTRSSVHQCRSARRFHCRQFRRPIFGEFSKKVNYPLSETDPETSNRFIARSPRGIPSFLRYQGWARDLKSRDRDETETFEPETETRPETSTPEIETRPRPLPSSPRRDRDETL
jgi:hypothetical protein